MEAIDFWRVGKLIEKSNFFFYCIRFTTNIRKIAVLVNVQQLNSMLLLWLPVWGIGAAAAAATATATATTAVINH